MKLRPYQKDAESKVFSAFKEGNRSALGVMPTGTGKTIVFASVIRRVFPKRVMVLAHRQELIWQARDKIKRVTGLTVDVEMGLHKARVDKEMFHPQALVIVSTIQTHTAGGDGAGRLSKFNPFDFGLLIIDEAHHATSSSYRRVINYYKKNPKLLVLGVTATPNRADEEALGQIFDCVAFDYEILDAIRDGWLVPIEQQMVSIESLDFSSIRTTAGDLNGADLDAIMTAEKPLHGVASATIDIIGDRRGIGFASSVEHAKLLANIFNRHRPGMSDWVCGATDKEDRKRIISEFAQGKIQWLWNCGVFTEGFDDSGIGVISMARPTKSRALYAQMAGRAMRPDESIAHTLNNAVAAPLRRVMIARSVKPSCLIIDFAGNSGRHKLMSTADILGGNVSDEAVEAAVIAARKSGKPMRMDKTLEEEEKRLEEMKQRKLQEEARKARLTAKASYKTRSVDPFDILQIKPIKARGWDDGKTLSEKQRGVLRNAGINPDELDYTKAKQLIGVMIERWHSNKCSLKQASLLKRYGYNPDSTFNEAKAIIDSLSKNGWRKPSPATNQTPINGVTNLTPDNGAIIDSDIPF